MHSVVRAQVILSQTDASTRNARTSLFESWSHHLVIIIKSTHCPFPYKIDLNPSVSQPRARQDSTNVHLDEIKRGSFVTDAAATEIWGSPQILLSNSHRILHFHIATCHERCIPSFLNRAHHSRPPPLGLFKFIWLSHVVRQRSLCMSDMTCGDSAGALQLSSPLRGVFAFVTSTVNNDLDITFSRVSN